MSDEKFKGVLFPQKKKWSVDDKMLSVIVKLNFLILFLGLAVYVIYTLNTRGLPSFFKVFFN